MTQQNQPREGQLVSTVVPETATFVPDPEKVIRIIYLDIDGVLNSFRSYAASGVVPWPIDANIQENTPPFVRDLKGTDMIAAGLVNHLCRRTGALIVLSSAWREGFTGDEVVRFCHELGVDSKYVIGRTGNEDWGVDGLGARINQIWHINTMIKFGTCTNPNLFRTDKSFNDFGFDPEGKTKVQAVILDDNSVFSIGYKGDLHDCFVRVDPINGFSAEEATEAYQILMGDPELGINDFLGAKILV